MDLGEALLGLRLGLFPFLPFLHNAIQIVIWRTAETISVIAAVRALTIGRVVALVAVAVHVASTSAGLRAWRAKGWPLVIAQRLVAALV